MKKNFLLSIAILSSVLLFGQNKNFVRGIVTDASTGEALPFTNIVINGTTNGTTSNVDGYFQLYTDKSGEVSLVVSYMGYLNKGITAKVNAKEPIVISLESQSQTIDEVSVNAENISKTLSIPPEKIGVVRMNPRLISNLPNMGEVDIFRALQLLPGISGTQETSSGLIIRGGTPEQNLILFDGMGIYHVDHFFGIFSAFNVNAIKDVQVYKGGFDAKYGGRVSGVVDIIGRDASMKEVKGNIGLNFLSSNASIEIPLIKDKLSVLVAGRRSYTDILKSGLYKKLYKNVTNSSANTSDPFAMMFGGTEAQIPKFYFYDFNSKLTFKPDLKNTFSLSLYSGKDYLDKTDVGNDGMIPQFGVSGGSIGSSVGIDLPTSESSLVDETKWGNHSIGTRWARQWNGSFNSNLTVSYSNYFSDYQYSSKTKIIQNKDTTSFGFGSSQNNNVNDLSIKLDNEWSVSKANQIQFGINYQYNDISYRMTLDDTLKLQDRRDNASIFSGYLQDKFTAIPRLTVIPGLRATKYSIANYNPKLFLEPRLSAFYQINENIRIKAAAGKYYQFLNRVVLEDFLTGARDFWILSNNEDVPVVSSKQFIVGGAYENKNFLFDVELYRKNMDGLLEYSMRYGNGGIQETDTRDLNANFFAGTGYVNGIDFLVQKKAGKYTGWIGYTFQKIEYKFDVIDQGRPFPASHDQSHEFKFVNMYSHKGWDFALTWIYATGKPYTAPIGKYSIEMLDGKKQVFVLVSDKNSLNLPSYHRMDVSVTRNFKINDVLGQVGLSVYNLYGHKNIKYRQFQKVDFGIDPKTGMFKPFEVPQFKAVDVVSLGFTPNIFVNIQF